VSEKYIALSINRSHDIICFNIAKTRWFGFADKKEVYSNLANVV